MTASAIATALGGAHRSGDWWRCRCPVHGSRGATLAIRDGDRGLIVRCWAGCDPRDVLAELRRRGLCSDDRHDRRPRPATAIVRADDRDGIVHRIEMARRIWDAARDARGSPVPLYLAGRGITMPLPPSICYAPSLRRQDGSRGPAMVARIDNLDGDLIGVHRTWLDRAPDGQWRRRDRAMLGRAAGGAVRLATPAETLMIAEGVETALAAMQATAIPAWASLSTSGLVALVLPPIVRTIVILADRDRSGAGERAARTAATRWLAGGRRVRIAVPSREGSDFNDVLLASHEACCDSE